MILSNTVQATLEMLKKVQREIEYILILLLKGDLGMKCPVSIKKIRYKSETVIIMNYFYSAIRKVPVNAGTSKN